MRLLWQKEYNYVKGSARGAKSVHHMLSNHSLKMLALVVTQSQEQSDKQGGKVVMSFQYLANVEICALMARGMCPILPHVPNHLRGLEGPCCLRMMPACGTFSEALFHHPVA